MRIHLITVLSMCLLYPHLAQADKVNTMPSIHYDHIAAKLIMTGYKDVRMVDPKAGTMSAYDRDGSEVIVRVDEMSRTILSTTFVHDADQ